MGRYLLRRLLTAIPTLLAISFVVFAILDLAPNDPTGNLLATYRTDAKGMALGESVGPDGQTWWFVLMDVGSKTAGVVGNASPLRLDRASANATRNTKAMTEMKHTLKILQWRRYD